MKRIGVVRQAQQVRHFLGEGITDAGVVLSRTRPIGRLAATPVRGLAIEVIDVGKLASSKKAVADIANGALEAPLLIAACHGEARLVAIVSGSGYKTTL